MAEAEQLRVFQIVWAAIKSPFANFGDFLRIASPPFLVAVLFTIPQVFFTVPSLQPTSNLSGPPFGMLVIAVPVVLALISAFIAATISFTVAWTRFVLIGREGPERWFAFKFGRRELNYVKQMLKVTVVVAGATLSAAIPVGAAAYFAGAGWLRYCLIAFDAGVVLILLCFLSLRLAFVSPSVIVDSFTGLRAAFEQTRGAVWRLAAISALSAILARVFQSILGGFAPSPATTVAGAVLLFVGFAIGTSAIAFAYRQKTNWAYTPAALRTSP